MRDEKKERKRRMGFGFLSKRIKEEKKKKERRIKTIGIEENRNEMHY
jgi:hypothetical protein